MIIIVHAIIGNVAGGIQSTDVSVFAERHDKFDTNVTLFHVNNLKS